MSEAVEAMRLSKRYRRKWALHDCSFTIPTGRIGALVGPNGAGKSTLLQLAAGLVVPTSGELRILGHSPAVEPQKTLPRIGFVAQEHPLYGGFTVAETLLIGRKLNPQWDAELAHTRLTQLEIPFAQRVGHLSGGQQAQVALVLALAKRPDLLLLDEPLASLDPLARRDFLRIMLDAAVDRGITVLLSSHIINDLERVCDYLIILSGGVVRLASDLEETMRQHKRLIGPYHATDALASRHTIIERSGTSVQTSVLARLDGPLFDTTWDVRDVSLEDIVLAYFGQTTHGHLSRMETAETYQ